MLFHNDLLLVGIMLILWKPRKEFRAERRANRAKKVRKGLIAAGKETFLIICFPHSKAGVLFIAVRWLSIPTFFLRTERH
ncbi:hypothetical protein VW41_20570 [Klebsiella michiganensis]|nr:hypothetical protein VW41_20570 [Klebsiella michiganensis]